MESLAVVFVIGVVLSSGLAFDVRLLTSCYKLMLDMMMMLIVQVVLSVVAGDFLCLLSTVAVFFDDLG